LARGRFFFGPPDDLAPLGWQGESQTGVVDNAHRGQQEILADAEILVPVNCEDVGEDLDLEGISSEVNEANPKWLLSDTLIGRKRLAV
jgi:hypothetical protein